MISRLPWSKVKNLVEVIIHPATAIDTDLFGSITESRLLESSSFQEFRARTRLAAQGYGARRLRGVAPSFSEQLAVSSEQQDGIRER